MRGAALCLVICGFMAMDWPVLGQEPLLPDILKSLDAWRGREITLTLRLSYVDRTFNRIVFYDRKNNSIEFDISQEAMKSIDPADFFNCHEGLEYRVTFVVRDRGAAGGLVGDLRGFTPFLMEKLP